jgi:hypothetical protein
MDRIRLPDEKWHQIVESTRTEFDITDSLLHRVNVIEKLSGWSTFGAIVGATYFVYYSWGAGGVLFFFLTALGPVLIGATTFNGLSYLLKYFFTPRYLKYLKAEKAQLEKASNAYEQQVRQTAEFWRGLDGNAFELEFANLLRMHGFKAEVTRRSGDGGIDIVSQGREGRVAIQCKRYAKPVGPAVIRELYGVVKADGFDFGILAVTGGVTKGVIEFVKDKPLRIIDLPEIVSMQIELNEGGDRQ